MAQVWRIISCLLVSLYIVAVAFEAVAFFAFLGITFEVMNEPCPNKTHPANLTYRPQFPFKCTSGFIGDQFDPHGQYPHYKLIYVQDGLLQDDNMVFKGRLFNFTKHHDDLESNVKKGKRNKRRMGDLFLGSSFEINVRNIRSSRTTNYFCNVYLCARDSRKDDALLNSDYESSKENISSSHDDVDKEYGTGLNNEYARVNQSGNQASKDRFNLTFRDQEPTPFLLHNNTGSEMLTPEDNAPRLVPYSLDEKNESSTSRTTKGDKRLNTPGEKDKNDEVKKIHFTFSMGDTTLNMFCKKNEPTHEDFEKHGTNAEPESVNSNAEPQYSQPYVALKGVHTITKPKSLESNTMNKSVELNVEPKSLESNIKPKSVESNVKPKSFESISVTRSTVRSEDKNDILTSKAFKLNTETTGTDNSVNPFITEDAIFNTTMKDNAGYVTSKVESDIARANAEFITEKNVMFSTTTSIDDFMKKNFFDISSTENVKGLEESSAERHAKTMDGFGDRSDLWTDGYSTEVVGPRGPVGESLSGDEREKDGIQRDFAGANRDADIESNLSWFWSVLVAIFNGRNDEQDRSSSSDVTESILDAMTSILSGNESVPRDWRKAANNDSNEDVLKDGRIPDDLDDCDAEEFFLSKLAIYLHAFGILASIFCAISAFKILIQGRSQPTLLCIATLAATVCGIFTLMVWPMATYDKTSKSWAFWPYVSSFFYILAATICIQCRNFCKRFCCRQANGQRGSGPWQNIEAGEPEVAQPAHHIVIITRPPGGCHGSNDVSGPDSDNTSIKPPIQKSSSSPSSPSGGSGGRTGQKEDDVSGNDNHDNAQPKPAMNENTPLLQATPKTDTYSPTTTTPLLAKMDKDTRLPDVIEDKTPTAAALPNGGVDGGDGIVSAEFVPNVGYVVGGQEPEYMNETLSLLQSVLATSSDTSAPINGPENAKADEATPLINGLDHQPMDDVMVNGTQDISIDDID